MHLKRQKVINFIEVGNFSFFSLSNIMNTRTKNDLKWNNKDIFDYHQNFPPQSVSEGLYTYSALWFNKPLFPFIQEIATHLVLQPKMKKGCFLRYLIICLMSYIFKFKSTFKNQNCPFFNFSTLSFFEPEENLVTLCD